MEYLQNGICMVKLSMWVASVNLRDAYYCITTHEEYQKYFKKFPGYPVKNKVMLNGNGSAMRTLTKLFKTPFDFL